MELGRIEAVRSTRFKHTYIFADCNEYDDYRYEPDLGVVCAHKLFRLFHIPRGTQRLTLVAHSTPSPNRIRVEPTDVGKGKYRWSLVSIDGRKRPTEIYENVARRLEEEGEDLDRIYVEVLCE